ncbi:hypothetical protein A3C18_02755 [Candidatus Kaiserbacteria bacterium RIFCSPHIGHO2_02_FULL_54_11b]|nr:MAG: hypothetical protein A3C18_02755 [Candidatus Kaiserbacteria bacterium RIFCSPHIGHO2_02_FULL_54_11b]
MSGRVDQDISGPSRGLPPRPPRRSSRLWIWAAASVAVLAAAAGLLFFFSSTTVSVTPKSRTATLSAAQITARQVEDTSSATSSVLSYTLQTLDLEDSEVVEAQGTTRVETKASGSITVYNSYSTSVVRLVKNTRFEAPGGLIFRAASDIVIPGKKGSVAGSVNITVVADQAGEKYNLGPVAKFTLPGLKSTAAMYSGVYAKSSAAMTGGFAGDQPGTAPGALEAAAALIRGRLETKAREAATAQGKGSTLVFPDLVEITYESLPNTTEAGTSVRVHQKAHVEIPIFPADTFAQMIAGTAFTDADNAPVYLVPLSDFSLQRTAPAGQGQKGILTMTASGSALIIWKVDAAALASALQGKDNSAFQGIVNGFSGIQEAHARIAPFWKSTFPAKTSDIKIEIIEPTAAK